MRECSKCNVRLIDGLRKAGLQDHDVGTALNQVSDALSSELCATRTDACPRLQDIDDLIRYVAVEYLDE